MREFRLQDICLGNLSIPDAASLVFSCDALKSFHGPSAEVGAWDETQRREIKYMRDVRNVKHPLKRFVMKDKVPVTAKQTIKRMDDEQCVVDSQVRLGCFGGRFITVASTFKIERKGVPARTFFSGEVRVKAALPGIRKMTEAMLVENAESELRGYAQHIQAKVTSVGELFSAHPMVFI